MNLNKTLMSALIILTSCGGSKNAGQTTEQNVCIQDKVKAFEASPKENPPRKVYSYLYNGQTVYYVTAVCCDQFSDLYDKECNLIGHPDGGFTGKGDGKFPDFKTVATEERLIWEDKR